MPTLPNLGLITPTLGGDSGAWDDKINACFALVDAHDHTSGKGVQVPVAGININADFAMAGHAVTGLGSLALNAVAALTTGSKRLFVSSADNELYWRTNAGTNVKLTNGTSINTTLVGGIVGDYSTVGAEVAYDDANKTYTFKDQSSPSKKWARLSSGPVRIHEYNTTESEYVEMAVDAALTAPYTVTWPAAPPASQAVVQITPTGDLIFSDYRNGQKLVIGAANFQAEIPSSGWAADSPYFQYANGWRLNANVQNHIVAPINLKPGDTITDCVLYLDKGSSSAITVSASIWKIAYSDGTRTAIESNTTSANAPGDTSIQVVSGGPGSITEVVDDTHYYQLEVSSTSGVDADTIRAAVVTYNRVI